MIFGHPGNLRAGMLDEIIDRNTAICDLPRHADCGLSIDHHQSNEPKEEEIGPIVLWEQTPSAARIAYNILKERIDLADLTEMMIWVDKLDGGTITIAEGPKIELISTALTDSQEVCNGDNILDIVYKINGAGNAQIPALVPATFSGLPNNLFPGIFNATTQQDSITVTGVASGDEIKVYINGVEFSSGVASASSAAAVASVTAGINSSINPSIAGQLVAADLTGGVMTLTAVTAGSPFTLSVVATGGVAAVTKSNQRGTGTFTISGQINQSHNTEMTYNYTITSLLNLNSCSAATATGTIKIEPIETVTYDNTINPGLYPGAATQELCPGTDMSGISFRIGGAVPSIVVAGLPPGVTSTPVSYTHLTLPTKRIV